MRILGQARSGVNGKCMDGLRAREVVRAVRWVYLPLSLDSMGVILFFNNLEEAQRKFLVVLAMHGRESVCG
jgi:hypothetical protein